MLRIKRIWLVALTLVVALPLGLAYVSASPAQPEAAVEQGDGVEWTRAQLKPQKHELSRMAYDSARGVLVLYGGFRDGVILDETWEWDGASWTLVETANSPGSRYFQQMAYDQSQQVVVLHGGHDALPQFFKDTWVFDGDDWFQVDDDGPLVTNGRMVYDTSRQAIVLFGGSADGPVVGDTWEWDGAQWTLIDVDGPPSRQKHTMVYDSIRGVIVMFGGDGGDGVFFNDVWEYDGVSWANVTPDNGSEPSRRFDHGMVFDETIGATIMFGGLEAYNDQAFQRDSWMWTGSRWIELEALLPQAAARFACTYDEARAKTVVFGGEILGAGDRSISSTLLLDSFHPQRWRRPQLAPRRRRLTSMAYDSAREVCVLFGGWTGNASLGDTWEWDVNASSWSFVKTPRGPEPRQLNSMAYDSAREVVVVHGGHYIPDGEDEVFLSDTWEYDGNDWQLVSDSGPQLTGQKMTYDELRQVVVMFGGVDEEFNYHDETWEWDGQEWTLVFVGGPSPRTKQGMAYDPVRQVIVLFGGVANQTHFNDTWEYDGVSWQEVFPQGNVPSPRRMAGMVYDSDRNEVLLFGGVTIGHTFQDTWLWNGISWIEAGTLPTPLTQFANAYDEANLQTVTFGGSINSVDPLRATYLSN